MTRQRFTPARPSAFNGEQFAAGFAHPKQQPVKATSRLHRLW